MYTGSCLCGGIQFEVTGELAKMQVCHCRQCRKAQGTPFATNILVNASDFKVVQGDNLLREFESATRPGKYRVFCRVCGSPIISRRSSAPEFVRVRAGTLNEELPIKVDFHAFVRNKANWWPITDDLPQHDEFAPS